MYKAIHVPNGEAIIILSPFWLGKIDQLRKMDQDDALVCQGCGQPLRVKAGELKRPHFAHKHLQACSFGTETPEILNARAVLYTWLERQFGPAASLEKMLPGIDLPRPVDCWVETGSGIFAYWLVESGIKLEPREAIKAVFNQIGVKIHFIFLHTMLVEEKKEFQSVLLTPTERAFMQTTLFDEMEAGGGTAGFSLHYLDATSETLTTFRSLTLFHRPNWFKGLKKNTLLENLLAGRQDGGIIHPGEMTRLKTIRTRQARLETRRKKFHEHEQDWENRLAVQREIPQSGRFPTTNLQPKSIDDFQTPLPCTTCGQVTSNYWSTFFDDEGRKLCRCRDCLGHL